MQPDLFWLMLREFPYTMDSPITNAPPQALKNGHRIEDVGAALPAYDRLWVEIKGC